MVCHERLPTAQVMQMYMETGRLSNVTQQRSARSKCASMLRKRGIKSAAEQHITVELGNGETAASFRRVIHAAIDKTVPDGRCRRYWKSRTKLHGGATKTLAKGAKNMRAVAQQYGMNREAARSDQQQYDARRVDPVLISQHSWHVDRPDEPEQRAGRNTKAIRYALKKTGLLGATQKLLLRKIEKKTINDSPERLKGTAGQGGT